MVDIAPGITISHRDIDRVHINLQKKLTIPDVRWSDESRTKTDGEVLKEQTQRHMQNFLSQDSDDGSLSSRSMSASVLFDIVIPSTSQSDSFTSVDRLDGLANKNFYAPRFTHIPQECRISRIMFNTLGRPTNIPPSRAGKMMVNGLWRLASRLYISQSYDRDDICLNRQDDAFDYVSESGKRHDYEAEENAKVENAKMNIRNLIDKERKDRASRYSGDRGSKSTQHTSRLDLSGFLTPRMHSANSSNHDDATSHLSVLRAIDEGREDDSSIQTRLSSLRNSEARQLAYDVSDDHSAKAAEAAVVAVHLAEANRDVSDADKLVSNGQFLTVGDLFNASDVRRYKYKTFGETAELNQKSLAGPHLCRCHFEDDVEIVWEIEHGRSDLSEDDFLLTMRPKCLTYDPHEEVPYIFESSQMREAVGYKRRSIFYPTVSPYYQPMSRKLRYEGPAGTCVLASLKTAAQELEQERNAHKKHHSNQEKSALPSVNKQHSMTILSKTTQRSRADIIDIAVHHEKFPNFENDWSIPQDLNSHPFGPSFPHQNTTRWHRFTHQNFRNRSKDFFSASNPHHTRSHLLKKTTINNIHIGPSTLDNDPNLGLRKQRTTNFEERNSFLSSATSPTIFVMGDLRRIYEVALRRSLIVMMMAFQKKIRNKCNRSWRLNRILEHLVVTEIRGVSAASHPTLRNYNLDLIDWNQSASRQGHLPMPPIEHFCNCRFERAVLDGAIGRIRIPKGWSMDRIIEEHESQVMDHLMFGQSRSNDANEFIHKSPSIGSPSRAFNRSASSEDVPLFDRKDSSNRLTKAINARIYDFKDPAALLGEHHLYGVRHRGTTATGEGSYLNIDSEIFSSHRISKKPSFGCIGRKKAPDDEQKSTATFPLGRGSSFTRERNLASSAFTQVGANAAKLARKKRIRLQVAQMNRLNAIENLAVQAFDGKALGTARQAQADMITISILHAMDRMWVDRRDGVEEVVNPLDDEAPKAKKKPMDHLSVVVQGRYLLLQTSALSGAAPSVLIVGCRGDYCAPLELNLTRRFEMYSKSHRSDRTDPLTHKPIPRHLRSSMIDHHSIDLLYLIVVAD